MSALALFASGVAVVGAGLLMAVRQHQKRKRRKWRRKWGSPWGRPAA